jgi:uncharacterized protein YbjT (DUF2867 family)
MRVLVLGAYGLIGAGVTHRLIEAGYRVAGLGRDPAIARRILPGIDWIIRDMATLRAPGDWQPIIGGFDGVVNCAGALQDGPRDALKAIHADAVEALASACAARSVHLVQISAAGVSPDASTGFMRSKAAGDAAVRAAGGDFTILRPGLVIAPSAYGGTTLLRMLAAIPLVQPIAFPDTLVRTTSLANLADAVELAVRGGAGSGLTFDLVEDEPQALGDIVAGMRQWLGFAPARMRLAVPPAIVKALSLGADALGLLGWRSPLRSTAMTVMREGVGGDPGPWRKLTGKPVDSFADALAAMRARPEDRIAARMALLMPFVVAVLFFLWAASGIVGICRLEAASGVLTAGGWPDDLARASVLFWSAVDIALAALLLVRRLAARACIAMVWICAVYLVAASLFTPWLWADPLGSVVKIVPIAVLSLVGAAMLRERQ